MAASKTALRRLANPEDWSRVLDAARETFTEDNPHGVFAFGIGRPIRKGRILAGATLNVYVRYKHARPKDPIPPIEVRGEKAFTIRPNVVASGLPPKALASGDPPPFSGLYSGAPIRVDGPNSQEFGGLGTFIGPSAQATHFLTAGHMFPPNALQTPVMAAVDDTSPPVVVGNLVANLLDGGGTIDAAAIALTDDGREMMQATRGGPPLTDLVAAPAVFSKGCRAFRPTTHDFSRSSQTGAGPIDALLTSDPRGGYWVRGAVATDGTITEVGDSGTTLVTGGGNQFALGILVGNWSAHSIAEPLGRVLDQLRPTLGPLQLIPNNHG